MVASFLSYHDFWSYHGYWYIYHTSLYVHSTIAVILVGKRELVALLYLSSWRLVMLEWLFLAVP